MESSDTGIKPGKQELWALFADEFSTDGYR